MHKQIYVNLAVDDLERSKAFFSAIGFSFDPQFTNEQAACLVLGENIYAMLLVKDLFKSFTRKSLCNPKESTEALVGCRARAGARWMRWSRRRLPPAARRRARRRTTASCTGTASRISTATSGS